MKRQVIVVGAGPAGATAAYYLAKAGVDVLLVDKEKFPRDKPCGDGLRDPAWPIYKEMGIYDEIESYGFMANGVGLSSPDQTYMGFDFVGPPGGILACPRKIVDAIVCRTAVEAGAELAENFEVTELVRKKGVVKGVKALYRGKPCQVDSDLVIVADGAHSRLAQQIGIYVEDPDMVYYAARGYFEDVGGLGTFTEFHYPDKFFLPCGYMWVFPLTDTMANIGAFILEGNLARSGHTLEGLFDWWRDNTEIGQIRLGKARLLGEIKGWRIPTCEQARGLYADGVMVAGDAGHMVETAYGGGQDLAMLAGRDAANVALEAIEKGDFSAKQLSVYDQKLEESTDHVYAMYNLQRKFLFGNEEQITGFIKHYAKKKADEGLDKINFADCVTDWAKMILLKMQAQAES